MSDGWDEPSGEPKQKEQKTIFTQSFSRSGGNRGGQRNFKDRNSDRNYGQNRHDDRGNRNNSGGYGRNQNDYDRGGNQRNSRFRDMDDDSQQESSSSYGKSQNSKTITIETRNIGRIIGRGGSKIKQLEQDSGARININRENRTETTEVTLQGSGDQVAKAEEMINDLMSEEGFSRPHERNNDYGSSKSYGRENESHGSSRSYGRDTDNYRSKKSYDRDSEPFGSSKSYDRDNEPFGSSKSHSRDNEPFGSSKSHSRDSDPFGSSKSYGRDNEPFGSSGSYQRDNNSNQNNDNYQSNWSNKSNRDDQYQSQSTSEPPADEGFKLIDWNSIYKESDAKAAAYLASLPPIVKKLYVEDPEIADMSVLEVAEFRLKNMNISVARVFAETEEDNVPIPNPIRTFEQAFRNFPEIMKTINDQNFTTPSPIQCQAWPVIMSGEDLIGIAQTGTGKTLAFLLPALLHIEAQTTPREQRVGPTVLILSPTRELAIQIEKEINKYSYRDIKCVCVYGGGDRKNQARWLREDRPEIIVATPGRLDDFVCNGEIKLDSVTYVVLDEADKMLEMGFECQIRKILLNIRSDRQTIMTSATWPSAVRRLATQYSVNPVQVVVGSLDLTAVHSVSQRIEIVDEEEKRDKLYEFLREMGEDDKVIVFCGKKAVTDDISSNLTLEGTKCQSLHGDREQIDREQALHDLKTGEVRILIATDVAARGLDIADITHIFNYDFPRNIEEYVHRIGRTGRAGRSGESVSLFTRRDWANAADLIKILEEANQGVPEELFAMAERFEAMKKRRDMNPRGGRGGRGGRGRGGGGNRY